MKPETFQLQSNNTIRRAIHTGSHESCERACVFTIKLKAVHINEVNLHTITIVPTILYLAKGLVGFKWRKLFACNCLASTRDRIKKYTNEHSIRT